MDWFLLSVILERTVPIQIMIMIMKFINVLVDAVGKKK